MIAASGQLRQASSLGTGSGCDRQWTSWRIHRVAHLDDPPRRHYRRAFRLANEARFMLFDRFRFTPRPGSHCRAAQPVHPMSRLRRSLVLCAPVLLAACGGGSDDAGGATPLPAEPTLEISSSTPDTAGGPFTLYLHFSALVTFNGQSGTLPFAVSGGKVSGALSQISPTLYAQSFIPNANAQGAVEVKLGPGAFSDASGRVSNSVNYSYSQPFDPVLPDTVPWVDMKALSPTIIGPFNVRITFNLDVGSSFTLSDLIVSGASATGLVRVDSTTWLLNLVPPTATSGIAIVQLPEGSVTAVSSGLANDRDWSFAFPYRTP